MIGGGHRATFPDLQMTGSLALSIDQVQPLNPLRFDVRVQDGGTYHIDFASLSSPDFVSEVVPWLQELLRRMGPSPIWRTVQSKVLDLRRFWVFLDASGIQLSGIDDLSVKIINRYEGWLEQATPSQASLRRIISPLIAILRLVAESDPERLPHDVMTRIAWLGRGKFNASRPRDAYSPFVATALRAAARRQIAEAKHRIVVGDGRPERRPDVEVRPELHPSYDAIVDVIIRDGWINSGGQIFRRFKSRAYYQRLPSLALDYLHGAFHLTTDDYYAFIVLVSLETGIEIECVRHLEADCLRNPSRGYVEIEYLKRRARGSEWKRVRVRDGGSSTPGSLIRLAISLTERARGHLGTTLLWARWDGLGLATTEISRNYLAAFVRRHSLVDDAGNPLHLELSRLRKTHKAERYIKTHGQLDDFAVGHTVAVAAHHYADIPALRHVHEQTIADALNDALDSALNPTILPPDAERACCDRAEATEPLGSAEQKAPFFNGDQDQDLWLASCGAFYSSPFGSDGQACPTPFWGCLECKNAVITVRKLPALIAFAKFMVEQRRMMDAGSWRGRFGRAYHRITQQILPAFPDEDIRQAEDKALSAGNGLLYLPPEAFAS
ncbi:hypothetical protein EJ074_00330 [Mesorhizobium sp. M3A.F.Ca.ET.080.04.2.1]|uniref:hypothetical protein n=1 Tax=Mesorhizobium sp. M3A.F.Ca.ET.080.04.2.1 TaxID=2493676 RepID=UPI000F752246|nr:hypothetical protein [Mesorhizobium sp. M3A.F.Ca.ET.080.04.2.1]AZO07744.1 hypothetical protein EJ074_00330 [Mesorhizobium sp. M3A.F.Ca.ET.080.04.2.1]RWF17755.1 MAG: hypothetical protein EOS64_22515 [Mesorhizobium sp.]